MARASRDTKLETRTRRLDKLDEGKRYFVPISEGVTLVYRRGAKGGRWTAKCGSAQKGYVTKAIGQADDHLDADNDGVLSFAQAQDRVRAFAVEQQRTGGRRPITVEDAATHYMTWFTDHRKTAIETQNKIDTHILPAFGKTLVSELTSKEIRDWHNKLATTPARRRTSAGTDKPAFRDQPTTDDAKRSRKSTANRILTVLKALLNKAHQDELAGEDIAWRRVKPFASADEPVTRFLTEAESTRLINACLADFRQLVKAALFTGARYGELGRLQVQDFKADTGAIYVTPESKSGKGRYIPLSPEGTDFFKRATVGKLGTALIFTKANGEAWGKNHHVKRLHAACLQAKIEPEIAFHELRHTFASTLAQLGIDLLTISKLLGHADTRITSRHYAHLCDRTLKAAMAQLPSFGHVSDTTVSAIR